MTEIEWIIYLGTIATNGWMLYSVWKRKCGAIRWVQTGFLVLAFAHVVIWSVSHFWLHRLTQEECDWMWDQMALANLFMQMTMMAILLRRSSIWFMAYGVCVYFSLRVDYAWEDGVAKAYYCPWIPFPDILVTGLMAYLIYTRRIPIWDKENKQWAHRQSPSTMTPTSL